LAAHPTGIRQRTQDIEDGADAELPPSRTRMAHRRMEGRREAEAHPRSLDAAPDAAGIERDVDSERLEHIGAPTPARGGPVSVLRHRDARAGRDERRRRRDIERAGSVAA